MTVKQKPDPKVVKSSAKEMAKSRKSAKPTMAVRKDARLLDDQKNAPQPHKPAKKGK